MSIKDQINNYRMTKCNDYEDYKKGRNDFQRSTLNDDNFYRINDYANDNIVFNTKVSTIGKRVENDIKLWPENTVLIAGSSILNGIEENRLNNNKNMCVKVRCFSGASVDDMYDYLLPLLKKRPKYLILQIGSNDAPRKTAKQIFDEMLELKRFINHLLPSVIVYFSCPVLRLDDANANLTLRHLCYEMEILPNIIVNKNVDGSCLGKKGLHLNPKGSGRLAINFLSLIRRL